MPPRKKTEDGVAPSQPERKSARIQERPAKPAPAAPEPKAPKRVKKTDPETAEYKPVKKPAGKKRKKADVEAEENEGGDKAGGKEKAKADNDEEKPKKKAKQEPKAPAAPKAKKAATEKKADTEKAKDAAASRTERRKSGVVTVQPTIEEGGSDEEEKLVVGSILPKVTLKNEKGEDVAISELVKETGIVIFAAPKADTPGCNKQACHFRDNKQDFAGVGYTVFGLTADPPAALAKWDNKNSFGYTLLSDPNRGFIKMLGADNNGSTKRSHFVFEKGTGKLLDAQIGVKPDTSHSTALAFVKAL